MSSDNRFMYQSAQEVPTSYAYSQYSQYDTTQYASPPRPVRNGAPAQPPPHSQHYPTPTNGYPPPPGYSGPAYGVTPSQNTPQWSSENWSQFPSPFSQPHPPIQEAQSFPSDSRPEIQSQSSGEPKGPPTGSQKLDNRRKDEQTSRQVEAPHQPKGRKTREDEIPVPPPVPALPSAPLGLDFMKLIDSYRVILDTTNTMGTDAGQGRHALQAESIERMLQAATYGAQALDSAVKRAAADVPRTPSHDERPAEEGDGSGGKARQKTAAPPPEGGQTCLGCNATSTPEWRRGPMGPRTLCNACGLVYAKLMKKRTREPGRSRSHSKQGGQSSRHDGLSSGDDGSDDGSNDSQSRGDGRRG